MRQLLIGIFCLGVVCAKNTLVFGLQTYPEKATARPSSKQQDLNCVVSLFGDFLLGRLNTELKAAATVDNTALVFTHISTISFVRHSFKPAFRAGFSLYFNKNIELFGQYLRQKNKNQVINTSSSGTVMLTPFFLPGVLAFSNGSIISRVDERFQTIDLLIKSRQLFNNGKVFVLPVIGLKGFIINHKVFQSALNASGTSFGISDTAEKLRLIGLIVGTDLKYIANRALFFYGSVKTGAAFGTSTHKKNTINNSPIIIQKQAENFSKFFDGDFGFATTFKLGHSLLGQFRIGVYMLYFEAGNTNINNLSSELNLTGLQQYITYQTIYTGASITF
jgi:hypothetical protein